MGKFDLSSYNDVSTRIRQFVAEFPEGSIQSHFRQLEDPIVVVEARVFRTREDVALDVYTSGFAREVEGKTNVNTTSHVENCVPLRSEMLTRNGFLRVEDLVVGEEVAAYDTATDQVRWTPLRGIVRQEDQPVFRFGTQSRWAFEATDNHRWVLRHHLWKGHAYRIGSLFDGLKSSDAVVQAAEAEGGSVALYPGDAALLGWLITDGTFAPDDSKFYVYQSKEEHLDSIRTILPAGTSETRREAGESLFPQGVVCVTRPAYRWRIPASYVRGLMAQAGITCLADFPALATRLTREARQAMLEAMLKADGSRRNNIVVFGKGKPEVMETFQILATLEGFGLGKMRMDSKKSIAVQTMKSTRHVNTSEFLAPSLIGTEDVWCPQTDYGTWIMRQDGNVSITGNCETSAIGRALANLGYATDASRASRSEMIKVERMNREMDGFIKFIADEGKNFADDATIVINGEGVAAKEYIRANWESITEQFALARQVVEAIELVTGRTLQESIG
jgi:hypothetical protein